MEKDLWKIFEDECSKRGILLGREEIWKFQIYLKELISWNKAINLTGLKDYERIVWELLLDSLIPLPSIPKVGKMLDMGSGAGFPAIPLKIVIPAYRIYMVESNYKKCVFLRYIIRLLKLTEIEVVNERVERRKIGPPFDIVTSKALGSFKRVVEYALLNLRTEGIFALYAGCGINQQLKELEYILKGGNLRIEKIIPYDLPVGGISRKVCLIKKLS